MAIGMAYKMKVSESSVTGRGKYKSASGRTECVEFIRQVTGAPHTITWKKGAKVLSAATGTISRGTAIATFDGSGQYPTENLGKHAAIYLSHTNAGIRVLDQWHDQGEVKERTIKANQPVTTKRSNNADTFFVIES
jgi:hypothetical protein